MLYRSNDDDIDCRSCLLSSASSSCYLYCFGRNAYKVSTSANPSTGNGTVPSGRVSTAQVSSVHMRLHWRVHCSSSRHPAFDHRILLGATDKKSDRGTPSFETPYAAGFETVSSCASAAFAQRKSEELKAGAQLLVRVRGPDIRVESEQTPAIFRVFLQRHSSQVAQTGASVKG